MGPAVDRQLRTGESARNGSFPSVGPKRVERAGKAVYARRPRTVTSALRQLFWPSDNVVMASAEGGWYVLDGLLPSLVLSTSPTFSRTPSMPASTRFAKNALDQPRRDGWRIRSSRKKQVQGHQPSSAVEEGGLQFLYSVAMTNFQRHA